MIREMFHAWQEGDLMYTLDKKGLRCSTFHKLDRREVWDAGDYMLDSRGL